MLDLLWSFQEHAAKAKLEFARAGTNTFGYQLLLMCRHAMATKIWSI